MKTCRFQDVAGHCPRTHAGYSETLDLSNRRPGDADFMQQLSFRVAALAGVVDARGVQTFSPCLRPGGDRTLQINSKLAGCCPGTYEQALALCSPLTFKE